MKNLGALLAYTLVAAALVGCAKSDKPASSPPATTADSNPIVFTPAPGPSDTSNQPSPGETDPGNQPPLSPLPEPMPAPPAPAPTNLCQGTYTGTFTKHGDKSSLVIKGTHFVLHGDGEDFAATGTCTSTGATTASFRFTLKANKAYVFHGTITANADGSVSVAGDEVKSGKVIDHLDLSDSPAGSTPDPAGTTTPADPTAPVPAA